MFFFTAGLIVGNLQTKNADHNQSQVILDLATQVRNYNKIIEREYGNVVEQLKTCSKQNGKLIKEQK